VATTVGGEKEHRKFRKKGKRHRKSPFVSERPLVPKKREQNDNRQQVGEKKPGGRKGKVGDIFLAPSSQKDRLLPKKKRACQKKGGGEGKGSGANAHRLWQARPYFFSRKGKRGKKNRTQKKKQGGDTVLKGAGHLQASLGVLRHQRIGLERDRPSRLEGRQEKPPMKKKGNSFLGGKKSFSSNKKDEPGRIID